MNYKAIQTDFYSMPEIAQSIITKKNSYQNVSKKEAKSFLKWAGGKTQLLEEIRQRYPKELGKSIKKYAEPFVGGGAVLFDILNTYSLDEVYISDKNAELINVYITLRDNCDELITLLQDCQSAYLPLNNEARKEFFYTKRFRFNELKKTGTRDVEAAALFIFLNRTCFNGLYRVNARGEYNVPMGAYKNPRICDADNLKKTSELLQNVTIVCADYKKSESFIDKTTFAYFDPPYRPLSASANFTSYTENEFNDNSQTELGNFIKKLDAMGAYVVASNSDPKNTNPDDNFFDDLYSGMGISRIYATRMINSNANARGKITEILVYSKEKEKKDAARFQYMVQ